MQRTQKIVIIDVTHIEYDGFICWNFIIQLNISDKNFIKFYSKEILCKIKK